MSHKWHLVNQVPSYPSYDYGNCLDCNSPTPSNERFCDSCRLKMEYGDREYDNRRDEEEDTRP